MLRCLAAAGVVAGLLCPAPSLAMVGYGTFVTLADGTMRVVQALKRGDRLAGPDGREREIFAISSAPSEKLITVTTNTGRKLVLTADHPVPVRRGEVPLIVNGVRLGDEVMTVEGFETVEYLTPARAGTMAFKLSIGEPGTREQDPLFADGVMISDEPL